MLTVGSSGVARAGQAVARDPGRKEQILSAAADLVARHGYHGVSMGAIGAEVGITGPAIYRHFPSKSALLVALFDRAIDRLLDDARAAAERHDAWTTLRQLVSGQVAFAVRERRLAQVYHNEVQNLPEEDRRRLRRKQRLYLEEWVRQLVALRPGISSAIARTHVHAAVGAIQSTLFHSSPLPHGQLVALLEQAAWGALGLGR